MGTLFANILRTGGRSSLFFFLSLSAVSFVSFLINALVSCVCFLCFCVCRIGQVNSLVCVLFMRFFVFVL